MPRPHPPVFRQRAAELARLREKPVARLGEQPSGVVSLRPAGRQRLAGGRSNRESPDHRLLERDRRLDVSVPIHLAVKGTIEVGDEALLVLAGDATDVLAGDAIETAEGVGVPPLRALVTKLREHEVAVYV